jgi:hypothetical protein
MKAELALGTLIQINLAAILLSYLFDKHVLPRPPAPTARYASAQL